MMINGDVALPYRKVVRTFDRHIGVQGGGALCVYHRGRKVVDVWAGSRTSGGDPWRSDTMAMAFSTTKGVVSTLIHVLADRGALPYNDPVATHWPEFARQGKEAITVGHVLTHRAGLARIRPLIDHDERILDWDYMVSRLENMPARPSRHSAYHAMTYGWLAGELIQRVTGRSLPEVIKSELVTPLGLDGMYIGAPPEAKRRAAEIIGDPRSINMLISPPGVAVWGAWAKALRAPYHPLLLRDALTLPDGGELLMEPRALDVPVPAANGLFTARSLARMYAAIAGNGTIDGVQLYSASTAEKVNRVRVHGRDLVVPLRMAWRLGYHGAPIGRRSPGPAFGHFGFGGSGGFADPRRDLSLAYITNRIGGGPFGDKRMTEFGLQAARAADALDANPVAARALELVPADVARSRPGD